MAELAARARKNDQADMAQAIKDQHDKHRRDVHHLTRKLR
jgi:hypothetical protein